MAEINQKDYIEGPAPENSGWRFTCIDMSKGNEKGLDTLNNLDLDNKKLLEKIGFTKNENGYLVLPVSNNTVEKSGKIVVRRVSEDGKVLYINRGKQEEQLEEAR